ncbi:MAG TPA: class I SAM-dependent methyltransferase [Burkholderiales bacterium]|nr:class I SAM-dependent methyltransferase [Burkholderiales bacterium]
MDLRRLAASVLLWAMCAGAAAQSYQPYEGQPGKDVVWVPTTRTLAEKMLDLAAVTPKDYVIDLGSGDGRMVIAAAKRGARALGVEYEPDMVALARKSAAEAGVADRATFVQGDLFEADISKATVLALFLLPANLNRLVPKFLELPAATRIVTNSYRIDDWVEEKQMTLPDCITWCTAYLYLVPAKVGGAWQLPTGELRLTQQYQTLEGSIVTPDGRETKVEGRVTGDHVRFAGGFDVYTGRVRGKQMFGEVSGASGGHWTASRIR